MKRPICAECKESMTIRYIDTNRLGLYCGAGEPYQQDEEFFLIWNSFTKDCKDNYLKEGSFKVNNEGIIEVEFL